jgi:hypothetical protein
MSTLDRLKKLLDESVTDLRAPKVSLGFDGLGQVCTSRNGYGKVLEGLGRMITGRGRVPVSVYEPYTSG